MTAWSTAGIIGPVVVNYIREFNQKAGVPADKLYDFTLYVLAGFLVLGFLCNALIRPVNPKWLMDEKDVANLQAKAKGAAASVQSGSFGIGTGGFSLGALLAWAAVGIPIAWGVWRVSLQVKALFGV